MGTLFPYVTKLPTMTSRCHLTTNVAIRLGSVFLQIRLHQKAIFSLWPVFITRNWLYTPKSMGFQGLLWYKWRKVELVLDAPCRKSDELTEMMSHETASVGALVLKSENPHVFVEVWANKGVILPDLAISSVSLLEARGSITCCKRLTCISGNVGIRFWQERGMCGMKKDAISPSIAANSIYFCQSWQFYMSFNSKSNIEIIFLLVLLLGRSDHITALQQDPGY